MLHASYSWVRGDDDANSTGGVYNDEELHGKGRFQVTL
jgi:hypothetical protein